MLGKLLYDIAEGAGVIDVGGEHDPWTHTEACSDSCNAEVVRKVFGVTAHEALTDSAERAGGLIYRGLGVLHVQETGLHPVPFEHQSEGFRERWDRVGRLLHEEYFGPLKKCLSRNP